MIKTEGQVQKELIKIVACCGKVYATVVGGTTPVAPDCNANTQRAQAKDYEF